MKPDYAGSVMMSKSTLNTFEKAKKLLEDQLGTTLTRGQVLNILANRLLEQNKVQ